MIFVVLIPKSHSTFFNLVNLIVFHALEILAVASHCKTMFSNPVGSLASYEYVSHCFVVKGAVPLNDAVPENLLKYASGTVVYRCAMCQSIKPPRAHHCRY